MSHLLWRSYWQDDVDRFRRLLGPALGYSAPSTSRGPSIGGSAGAGLGGIAGAAAAGSPGAVGTSPARTHASKMRKSSALFVAGGGAGGAGGPAMGKAEVNSRDHAGLTLLLRAASSASPNAVAFVRALLEHPALDIYAQDNESGWNALHRALYAGNISIARLLLDRERKDLTEGVFGGASLSRIGQLIKTKDHEGNSPFDLFASTIGERSIQRNVLGSPSSDDGGSDSEESLSLQDATSIGGLQDLVDGDELFMFGSNKNMSLGVGDESDRQYPERVHLRRPDHLFHAFHADHLDGAGLEHPGSLKLEELPAMILTRPLEVRDVVLSKFHSAIVTTDPVSNLYICGIGRGGRLGLSDDQRVRFTFVPVQGGLADRQVAQVALGQDHSIAVTSTGELWTWGSNTYSQLGYVLSPPTKKDEGPMGLFPRQVFGVLKKEIVVGAAASAIHSVAYTSSSLYCWGKNMGQLALMDADSRSLEIQSTPRKVAVSLFSASIVMASAIDKATTVLLANHTVYVFTSYGYNWVKFPPIDPFADSRIHRGVRGQDHHHRGRKICYIDSGGDTIAAVTGRGDLFVMGLNHDVDASSSASTTNPSKIRGAVGQPQCIWRARKDGVKSVGVGDHGSVIIATESGAVWRRVWRATAKDAYITAGSELARRKDFKFQRIPYIAKIVTVRTSPSGAFAAVRRDLEVMKKQITVDRQSIQDDVSALLPLRGFVSSSPRPDGEAVLGLLENDGSTASQLAHAINSMLYSTDLVSDMHSFLAGSSGEAERDTLVCSSSHPDLKIPVHGWVMCARSLDVRDALARCRSEGSYTSTGLTVELANDKALIKIEATDILTVLNIVVWAYTSRAVPAWNIRQPSPTLTQASRQLRVEVMKVAARLHMSSLEAAARLQNDPTCTLTDDLESAMKDPVFFQDADVVVELDGGETAAHSSLLCQRCPYFDGLFRGRSAGMWLASRLDTAPDRPQRIPVDMKHFEPKPFSYVMRYMYTDAGEELFDATVAPSFEDFTGLVLDVLAIANELMLDRLSQICQKVMGRFVNTRNIAHLLNEISPCSVTMFKDAGLEYLCMQVETMLENHMLDDLEEDLLVDLDDVVKENQAENSVKSRHIGACLQELHPELMQDIEEERQRRVREMAWKASQRDGEKKLSSSYKGRVGSLDDLTPAAAAAMTTPDKARKKTAARNEPFSPVIRPKASVADLMFEMEDDKDDGPATPLAKLRTQGGSRATEDEQNLLPGPKPTLAGSLRTAPDFSASPTASATLLPNSGSPWQAKPLAMPTLDLREIMSEASSKTPSALSAGLAAQKPKEGGFKAATPPQSKKQKPSQREKKQQQVAAQEAAAASQLISGGTWETAAKKPAGGSPSPWKPTPATTKISLKDALSSAGQTSGPPPATPPAPAAMPAVAKPLVAVESTSSSASASVHRRTASPDTRFAGQSRAPGAASASPRRELVPHSKSYLSPAAKSEPTLGLSMADIIGQQRREQELVREAVAKRSLQEIQQEQAFQEWWDQESRRTQDEERRRAAKEERAAARAAAAASGAAAGGRRKGINNKSSGNNNNGNKPAPAADTNPSGAAGNAVDDGNGPADGGAGGNRAGRGGRGARRGRPSARGRSSGGAAAPAASASEDAGKSGGGERQGGESNRQPGTRGGRGRKRGDGAKA